jgi:hypothetical protein
MIIGSIFRSGISIQTETNNTSSSLAARINGHRARGWSVNAQPSHPAEAILQFPKLIKKKNPFTYEGVANYFRRSGLIIS